MKKKPIKESCKLLNEFILFSKLIDSEANAQQYIEKYSVTQVPIRDKMSPPPHATLASGLVSTSPAMFSTVETRK